MPATHTTLNRNLLTVLLLSALASTAYAQVQHQPPWWNQPPPTGDGRTTTETWGFDTANSDATTHVSPNPQNPPSAADTEGDAGWVDEAGGRTGVMGVKGSGKRGSVTFWVWNGMAENSKKHLWVQYDSYVSGGSIGGPSATFGPDEQRAGPGGFSVPHPAQDLGGGWKRHWRQWEIEPQPAFEEITFTFGTLPAGGTAVIDNLHIGTHCEGNDHKGDCMAHDNAVPGPPEPVWTDTWPGHGGATVSLTGGFPPDWMPGLTSHDGVLGLPGGMPADGTVALWADDYGDPTGNRHVACQFDFYMADGGAVIWTPETSPGSVIENYRESIHDIGDGWQRAIVRWDVTPPGDWKQIRWDMFTDPLSGPVAIDSMIFSSGTMFANDWYEDFDLYDPGIGLHGQGGWSSWDSDPNADGATSEAQARTPMNSLEIAGDTDLVREFDGFDEGRWTFAAWQYIPSDFDSGSTGQFAGSYFMLLNRYDDGGPHTDADWSIQMQFDSNDGMLKVYYGNGLNTVNVPYDTDRWVKIQATIDLEDDWTQIYYDDDLVAEYSWTGGILGEGGGALDIAAVDLYAFGSSPIFYDDLRLWPGNLRGDLDCDGEVGFGDINPFVLRLTDPATYAVLYPDCHDENGDINLNGEVGFDDINPFVALLVN